MEGIAAASKVADMVETDIRRSEDGSLLLSHDPIESPDGLVRLDELLQALPKFPFNLEIKNYPGEPDFDPDHTSALETAAMARPFDLLTCFFWPTVDAIHRSFPEVATGLLLSFEWDLEIAVKHALRVGHRTLAPHWTLALGSAEVTRKAVANGLEVVVWTLNDLDYVPELANLGVAGIITDDPGTLNRALGDLK
jgi:glycerophosphoryl diester phosphodiesterase